MKYELKENDVFEIDGSDYITLDIVEYNNLKYCFTNKLLNEDEPSKEFFVFRMDPKGLVKEKNQENLNEVMKIFSSNMNKKIEYLRKMEELNKRGENNG